MWNDYNALRPAVAVLLLMLLSSCSVTVNVDAQIEPGSKSGFGYTATTDVSD
jgi:hypothetical protein